MRRIALIAFLSLAARADTANTSARTLTKLGDGIWEIRHPDAPDGFPQGNTTVIAGDRAVLVVDSCLLPSSAQKDIEQIRKWTQGPGPRNGPQEPSRRRLARTVRRRRQGQPRHLRRELRGAGEDRLQPDQRAVRMIRTYLT
jgi:hypothetical protein